ncbi:1-phosphatidylinositol 4,5-bisphosphate phosphodiesterase eta-2-like [Lampetra planeri]
MCVPCSGFQPLWDETLVFIIHMPELAMVRFVVWDDDPIGRNFIGQKTIALSSILPGYRHVRLEGLSEASIFVYVTVEQIHGKARQASNLMRALGCKSRECGVGDAPRRRHGMRATPRTSLP